MSYKKSAKAIARVLRHVDHASSLDAAVASMLQRDPGAANEPDEPNSRTAAIGGYVVGGFFVPHDAPSAYLVGGLLGVGAGIIGWRIFNGGWSLAHPIRRGGV